jgi:hypothetical protein
MNDSNEPDDFPDWLFDKSRTFRVEPTKGGYWCHPTKHRSAGDLREIPLSETLKWILEQIIFGHLTCISDEYGDVVSLNIGKHSPRLGSSEEEVGKQVFKELLGFGITGVLAQCRESGSYPKSAEAEGKIWEVANDNFKRRMEIHYALVLSRLLGHISKKLPSLELLPILDAAPVNTKEYIAEATRCYLLKLDRACISLCRACLEDTLKNILTEEMKDEWNDEMSRNRQIYRNPHPMKALIEVCGRHDILKNHEGDAHDIREAGNRILHFDLKNKADADLASQVLWKTRKIIGLIYGGQQ